MPANIAEQMQNLYGQFGELPGIHIELHKELLAIRVENQQAVAVIFLQGAQLSHYQLKNKNPIIWCSDKCDYREGKSLRGGIPLCWPWFGDLSRNGDEVKQSVLTEQSSAHGFVRELPWQLTNININNSNSTHLTLVLEVQSDTQQIWPFKCSLQLDISIGRELTHSLTVKNCDKKAISFTNAFHSYFAIGDINQIEIEGLDQLEYIDCVANWSSHKQQQALKVDREIDRIYFNSPVRDSTNPEEVNIVDHAWQRTIKLFSEGNNSTVVWNPWIEKSKRLSNFHDQDYKKMLCVEIANTSSNINTDLNSEKNCIKTTANAIKLEPGQSHVMKTKVSCVDFD